MRYFVFLLFSVCTLDLVAQEKLICITIDDLPVVSYGDTSQEFSEMVTDRLLAGLKEAKIPAIGFVNESKLFDDEMELLLFQKNNLEKWLAMGMELGNHTFSHFDFNTTDFGTFTADILLGEKVSRKLAIKYQYSFRYFRHPYLHAGERKSKADSLETFLKSKGYIVAPVTIDNDDYLFARAYHLSKKAGNDKMARKIGSDYLKYMEEKLMYYENQSQKLFGRNISQILLIHASWLNADYVDDLAAIYKKNGYRFVSLDRALEDEAYQTEITRFGKYGISWIDRWALSAGKTGEFFEGDPEVPVYVKDLKK